MNSLQANVYFKNHRALSVTALSTSLKHQPKRDDYTPEKTRLTVDFDSEVRRVDSHAAILGPKNVSSLPELQPKRIGQQSPHTLHGSKQSTSAK